MRNRANSVDLERERGDRESNGELRIMAEGESVQSGRSNEDGGGGKEEGSEESVKLFVGQVPKNMTEIQLLDLFKEVAVVEEVKIIKDKFTKASRGVRRNNLPVSSIYLLFYCFLNELIAVDPKD